MSKTKTIVTTTTALSSVADKISDNITKGAPLSKQAILNIFAAGIAGPKHDWGYLTGSESTVLQRNLTADQIEAVRNAPLPSGASPQKTFPLLSGDGEGMVIHPREVDLFSKELSDLLREAYVGDFRCISCELSMLSESGQAANTDDDRAMCIAEDGQKLDAWPIFGAAIPNLKRFSLPYTASSSSGVVNDLIREACGEMDEIGGSETYRSFLLPHAVIVAVDYPFSNYFKDHIPYNEWEKEEVDANIRVYIEAKLSAEERELAIRQAEDVLIRLAMTHAQRPGEEWKWNIHVSREAWEDDDPYAEDDE